jgi:hypothetical protein
MVQPWKKFQKRHYKEEVLATKTPQEMGFPYLCVIRHPFQLGGNPFIYRKSNDPINPIKSATTAPQNPFIKYQRLMRTAPHITARTTSCVGSKSKKKSKLEPSKPPATTAYSNKAYLIYPAMKGFVNCPRINRPNEFIN